MLFGQLGSKEKRRLALEWPQAKRLDVVADGVSEDETVQRPCISISKYTEGLLALLMAECACKQQVDSRAATLYSATPKRKPAKRFSNFSDMFFGSTLTHPEHNEVCLEETQVGTSCCFRRLHYLQTSGCQTFPAQDCQHNRS